MNLQDQLKLEINRFQKFGDASNLQELIASHPELISREFGEYPDFHRIIDINVGSESFRVCRQISLEENITFTPIDEVLDLSGVPLWLEGEKLRAWAKNEEENPSDEPTDWEKYR